MNLIEKKLKDTGELNNSLENKINFLKNENESLKIKLQKENENIQILKNSELQTMNVLNKLKTSELKLNEANEKYNDLEMKFKDNINKSSATIIQLTEIKEKQEKNNKLLTAKLKDTIKERNDLSLKLRDFQIQEFNRRNMDRVIDNECSYEDKMFAFGDKFIAIVQKNYFIILTFLISLSLIVIYKKMFKEDSD